MMLTILDDLRPRMVGVRDQGPRPTCLAFAISDAHSYGRGSASELAVDYLYYHASIRNGPSDFQDGLFLDDAEWALNQRGQPLEIECPYTMVLPTGSGHWPPVTDHPSSLVATAAGVTATVGEIITLIKTSQAPVVVMRLSPSFFHPNEHGVITPVPHESDDVGTHAVICVGLGTHQGKEVILIRNSWGEGWGDHGHAWVYHDYLSDRLETVSKIFP